MSFAALRIRAAVRMEPDRTPLIAGRGITIALRGKYFPGRILVCNTPINPRERGEAIIGVLASSLGDVEMRVGSEFELKDSPTILIAVATVLEVEESRILELQAESTP